MPLRCSDGQSQTVAPSENGTGIQAAVDAAAQSDVDVVQLARGEYIVNEPPILIPGNVDIIGSGIGATTVKLAAGLDNDAESVFEFRGSKGAIRNLEIDGNAPNNTYEEFGASPFSHGIRVANYEDIPLQDIDLENLYIHDAIRSCVTADADYCTFRNLRLENGDTDHWLYLSGGEGHKATNIDCRGACRDTGIVVGSTVKNSTVENVTMHDMTANSKGNIPEKAVHFRATELTETNNTLRNIHINHIGGTVQAGAIEVNQPNTTIENVTFRGYFDNVYFIEDSTGDAEGSTYRNISIEHRDSSNLSNKHAMRLASDNQTVTGLTMVETSGDSKGRGITLVDGTDGVSGITISDMHLDVGDIWLRAVGSNGGLREIAVNDIRLERGNSADVAGDVYYTRNGRGEEAVGASGTPTASNWRAGDIVENTSPTPSELYQLREDGSWMQLA